ncbi:hypothetical protein AVEN_264365-1 [Araneus ventricosus]|uniref:Uncharacterized protein n=1 Tax=Araneus ventricosus TaxID=182803 RepID=A0A4Y2H9F5_ARAVE|nr:hypothetical protein AVEN_264365-1 [Araneus ventricosus]
MVHNRKNVKFKNCYSDLIEPSESEIAHPIVCIAKKDSSLKMCIDFRGLNAVTKVPVFPMKSMQELIFIAGSANWSTSSDLLKEYWQTKMDEESKLLTAFTTHNAVYKIPDSDADMAGTAENCSDTDMKELRDNSTESTSKEALENNMERGEHLGVSSQQNPTPRNDKSVDPTTHRPRDKSPTSIQISDEFIVENTVATTQAITLKQFLAEWSRTMRTYPKRDPGYQRVLEETQNVNINLNSLLATLGVPLFKLPESSSHLAQITERAKRNQESETIKVSPATSHPKVKINLEGNRINPNNSPKKNRTKRVANPEGFIIPAKHLVARNPKKVAIESAPILATPPLGKTKLLL